MNIIEEISMSGIIIGGPGNMEGLEEFLNEIRGGKQESKQEFKSGDLALLAERFEERKHRNMTLKPGDLVQFRADSGLGFPHYGPFCVVRVLPDPVKAEHIDSDLFQKMYLSTELDMVVSFIMHSGGEAIYRETYAWSGMMCPYEMSPIEKEVWETGIGNAKSEEPRKITEDTPRDIAAEKPKTPPSEKRSGWMQAESEQ